MSAGEKRGGGGRGARDERISPVSVWGTGLLALQQQTFPYWTPGLNPPACISYFLLLPYNTLKQTSNNSKTTSFASPPPASSSSLQDTGCLLGGWGVGGGFSTQCDSFFFLWSLSPPPQFFVTPTPLCPPMNPHLCDINTALEIQYVKF